jgi:hypothetical protein
VPTNRVGFPFLFFFPLFQCCLRLIYLSLFSAFVAIILTRTLIRFRFLYLTKLLILHTDYFYVGLLSLRLFSVYSSFCTFVTFFKIIWQIWLLKRSTFCWMNVVELEDVFNT